MLVLKLRRKKSQTFAKSNHYQMTITLMVLMMSILKLKIILRVTNFIKFYQNMSLEVYLEKDFKKEI